MIHYFYLFLVILGMVMDGSLLYHKHPSTACVSWELQMGEPGQRFFSRMDPHGHDGLFHGTGDAGNAWNMKFDIIHPICLPGPMWYVHFIPFLVCRPTLNTPLFSAEMCEIRRVCGKNVVNSANRTGVLFNRKTKKGRTVSNLRSDDLIMILCDYIRINMDKPYMPI